MCIRDSFILIALLTPFVILFGIPCWVTNGMDQCFQLDECACLRILLWPIFFLLGIGVNALALPLIAACLPFFIVIQFVRYVRLRYRLWKRTRRMLKTMRNNNNYPTLTNNGNNLTNRVQRVEFRIVYTGSVWSHSFFLK
eukprot:TRINITY_DN14284_c0_g1_i1.p1 TRINITY_DN14284_c0_g1~~TRINITY_DN14284_c0_g1_i1.p1  ORF type:complete len:159 (+),score=7.81 TRINITY_DN14284_c0_g1_i1:60-479(+)